MNSIQIDKILRNNRDTKPLFRGVYAADTLIEVKTNRPPYCCVVNSDKHSEPGTHWMAIFVPSEHKVEFFDSFAEHPNASIEKFLDSFRYRTTNHIKVQLSFDTSCAAHVIYFLVNRCRGATFNAITRRLASNRPFSDSIVKLFVVDLLEKSI
jgi:hypothetical protein